MCRFAECRFAETDLQLQTLTQNFGLVASKFTGRIRDNRADGPHRTLSVRGLKKYLQTASLTSVQALGIEYFFSETLLTSSLRLDRTFSVETWLSMFRTAGSFSIVLSKWVEFLLWLYDKDRVTIHTLLQVHSMTDELLTKVVGTSASSNAITSISGIHMSLARAVDEYLVLLGCYCEEHRSKIAFLVEGHHTKSYYYRNLSSLFSRAPARITRLVRHNSPWDLEITFTGATGVMLFLALFLASRTRIELTRLRRTLEPSPKPKSPGRKKVPSSGMVASNAGAADKPETLFLADFGGNHTLRASPNMRLRAYLPGNLVAELQLDFKSRHIAKLRKIIKDVL